MFPAEAPKMLIGTKESVPVDKTLKAALLSILKIMQRATAVKAIAAEYLIFQKFFGLCGFNRSFSYFNLESHIHILFTA